MTTKKDFDDALHQLKQLASAFTLKDQRVLKLVRTVESFVEQQTATIKDQAQLIDDFNVKNRALGITNNILRAKQEA